MVRIAGAISPVIENFEIVNGRAPSGAGIFNQNGTPIIRHNKIYGNQANTGAVSGGGIYDGGAARIERNEIYNNSTGSWWPGWRHLHRQQWRYSHISAAQSNLQQQRQPGRRRFDRQRRQRFIRSQYPTRQHG